MPQATASAFALALLAIGHAANAAPCESLTSLSLPNVTVTMAQPVAAGAFTAPGRGGAVARFENVPAFCRVQASLKPTADSDIRMELWLPLDSPGAGGWNGKFRGTGNGGLGGGTGANPNQLAAGVR